MDTLNPSNTERLLSRRGLLRWALWGSLLFAGATFFSGIINLYWPRKVGAFGGRIVAGPPDAFARGSVTRFPQGKFYLVHLDEGFQALYWTCPHLGCTVPWLEDEGLFICPCHGSTYLPTGQFIKGPTQRSMDQMNLKLDNGRLVVDTGEIHERRNVGASAFLNVS